MTNHDADIPADEDFELAGIVIAVGWLSSQAL